MCCLTKQVIDFDDKSLNKEKTCLKQTTESAEKKNLMTLPGEGGINSFG